MKETLLKLQNRNRLIMFIRLGELKLMRMSNEEGKTEWQRKTDSK